MAFVIGLSKKKQKRLLDITDQICYFPVKVGDIALPDADGRDIESVLIDEFLISFWIDHAVKEIRFTEIHIV